MTYKKIMVMPVVLVFTFMFLGSLWAARIILKEGKTLHGRITYEDDQQVEIILGQNMMLRVDKDKVEKIIRKKKPEKKAGRTVTMESVKKEAEKKQEGKKDPPSEKPKKDDKPTLLNITPSKNVRSNEKKGISIQDTLVYETYPVKATTAQKAIAAITDRDSGKGFLVRRDRTASKTKLQAEWSGQSKKELNTFRWTAIVVMATMTVTVPEWKAPSNIKDSDIKQWNAFIANVQSHDVGHVEIYLRELISMGETISALREPTEADLQKRSEKTFAFSLKRAEKRQRGYDRRHKISTSFP